MIEVGKQMAWHKVVSNYGHINVIHVTVKKVGKRITVEAPIKRGGTRITTVTPARLHEIAATR